MISKTAGWIRERLELPEVRGFDPDSPELIPIHRRVISSKRFLASVYRNYYREFLRGLQGAPAGPVVEIGSGGGFLKEILPEVITTDLQPEPHLDRAMTAERLDFENGSIAAILGLNVFHHLPDPRSFLREAARTLKPGGRVVLIEPTHTWLWRRLYRVFSAEPYDEKAVEWGFPRAGRFTGANLPLAWIVFERDRSRFEAEFPELRLLNRRRHTAFLYLLSGGVSYRTLVPPGSFPLFQALEWVLTPAMPWIASESTYVLERTLPAG